jgi:hypothetical protein
LSTTLGWTHIHTLGVTVKLIKLVFFGIGVVGLVIVPGLEDHFKDSGHECSVLDQELTADLGTAHQQL